MRLLTLTYIAFLCASCNSSSIQNSLYYKIAGETQGTSYHITYEVHDSINLKSSIDSLLHQFDLSLSTYDPNSIISKINHNEKEVELDKKFKTVFYAAEEIYKKTDGAFDITVGPLVDIWGFGRTEETVKPNEHQIDSLLEFIGMNKITIQNNQVVKDDPRIQLDVNAIAQGYAVDVVAHFLEELKIDNYLVEIGGEVRTKGLNPNGEIWKIGVDKPEDDNHLPGKVMQAVVKLPNMALATSGNYRKFFVEDGVKYAHSIDPKTGKPVKHTLLSATIFAKNCMDADAYATACMVVGLEKAQKWIEKTPSIEAYFIYSDKHGLFHTWQSKGAKKYIVEEF